MFATEKCNNNLYVIIIISSTLFFHSNHMLLIFFLLYFIFIQPHKKRQEDQMYLYADSVTLSFILSRSFKNIVQKRELVLKYRICVKLMTLVPTFRTCLYATSIVQLYIPIQRKKFLSLISHTQNGQKAQVWAFLLWKDAQIQQEGSDKDATNPWKLYQKWCKMDMHIRDSWIAAGKTIQTFTKISNAKMQDSPRPIQSNTTEGKIYFIHEYKILL